MAAIYEQYTEEMHREFGYSATWLPSARLQLGDVGLFRRDRFDRVTSLGELGVAFEDGGVGGLSDLEYSSAGQVEVSWRADAGVAPAAAAEALSTVSVLFRRAHAILFQARNCRVRAVLDLARLESALRSLAENGTWQRKYAVITEIVETESAAVLVSSQANARIDFRLRARGTAGPFALAQAAGQVGLVSASGVAVRVMAPDGLTPLFRASAFRSRIRRPPQLTYRGDESPVRSPAVDGLELGTLSYSDALSP